MSRATHFGSQFAVLVVSVSVSGCHSDHAGQTANALAACDSAFDALYVQCAQATLPADTLSRMRQRYEQVCQRGLALPGVAVTPEQLTSCSSKAAADGCRISSTLSECLGAGTLAGGASCTDSLQCASSSCEKPFLYDPDSGTSRMLTCGSCVAVIPVGGPCSNGAQGQCAPGAQCNLSSPNPTCLQINTGNIGTSCINRSGGSSCKSGLYCDPFTGNCEPPQEAGARCTSAADCAYPLTCTGSAGQACQNPGDAGALCFQDGDCAKGLVCDESMTPSQCVAPRWAGSGQPCGSAVRCLVGNCSSSFFGSGTCPVVLLDRQPCGSKNSSAETCDAFASCINGVCSLESVACP